MYISYYAIFQYDEDGLWLKFPDLPGCNTCGNNYNHARQMAKEALELYLHGMSVAKLPKQTQLETTFLNNNQEAILITTNMEVRDGKLFNPEVTDFSEYDL